MVQQQTGFLGLLTRVTATNKLFLFVDKDSGINNFVWDPKKRKKMSELKILIKFVYFISNWQLANFSSQYSGKGTFLRF